MRVIKGIVLGCFCLFAFSACFEAPEFGNTPYIEFKKIEFRKEGASGEEIILYLDFRDGDGDLGLSTLYDADYPYHNAYYYLHDGLGDTTQIIPKRHYEDGIIYTFLNSCIDEKGCEPLPGKIVTNKTRTLPNYGYLPVYDPLAKCPPYETLSTIIGSDASPIPGVLVPLSSVDDTYDIEEMYEFDNVEYARISDPLLYKSNPYSNNIEVRFLQFENGNYVEYVFPGCQNYFGRFETSDTDVFTGKPVEGTIRFTMSNSEFLATFGSRVIKVSVRIRDRALNVSNTVESQEFRLNEIRID